jgi:hypothetical protein
MIVTNIFSLGCERRGGGVFVEYLNRMLIYLFRNLKHKDAIVDSLFRYLD